MIENQPAEPIKDPMIGEMFAGRYRIDRFLARSSMSAVYAGSDINEGKPVAIKLLNGLIDDQETLQRFHREAQIARSLMHPNICAFLDHGITGNGTPYHVMEFIEGQSLEMILAVVGALDPALAVKVFIKTCRAVQYLHSRGIVHRDIKPENLMIPSSQTQLNVKVIDFGIAKGTKSGVHQSVELTKPGEVFGSLLYTAPERLAGQPADARSDIYSIGCVMYETLAGKNPFSADSSTQIAERQARHVPEPLSQSGLDRRIALLLQPIVAKALDKNPNRRYQSAAELKDALELVEKPVKVACVESETGVPAGKEAGRTFGVLEYVAFAAATVILIGATIYAGVLVQEVEKAGLRPLLGF